jgi:hypothetical protein
MRGMRGIGGGVKMYKIIFVTSMLVFTTVVNSQTNKEKLSDIQNRLDDIEFDRELEKQLQLREKLYDELNRSDKGKSLNKNEQSFSSVRENHIKDYRFLLKRGTTSWYYQNFPDIIIKSNNPLKNDYKVKRFFLVSTSDIEKKYKNISFNDTFSSHFFICDLKKEYSDNQTLYLKDGKIVYEYDVKIQNSRDIRNYQNIKKDSIEQVVFEQICNIR